MNHRHAERDDIKNKSDPKIEAWSTPWNIDAG